MGEEMVPLCSGREEKGKAMHDLLLLHTKTQSQSLGNTLYTGSG